jgi:hypothetical protein
MSALGGNAIVAAHDPGQFKSRAALLPPTMLL